MFRFAFIFRAATVTLALIAASASDAFANDPWQRYADRAALAPDPIQLVSATASPNTADSTASLDAVIAAVLNEPGASEEDAIDQILYLLDDPVPPGPTTQSPLPTSPFNPFGQGRGWFGVGYSYTSDDGFEEHLGPDLSVRYLLTDWLEVRAGWSGVSFASLDGIALEDDVSEPNIGLTAFVCNNDGWRPALAVSAALPIATNTNPFSSDSLLPVCELLYGWNIGESARFSARSGITLINDSQGTDFDFRQGASWEYFTAGGSVLYGGWTGFFPKGFADEHSADAGFQKPIWNGWFWDGRVSAGINRSAPDLIVSTGLTIPF